MKRKLTAQFVKHAPLPKDAPVDKPPNGRIIYWDESLRGFGLMVTDKGHKSWVIQYRAGGKTHRITLNERGYSLEEARGKAHETLGKVAKGEDPATKAAKDPTFGEVADNFLRLEGNEFRSAALYKRTLDRLVLPTLGKLQISTIRRSQIVNLRDGVKQDSGEGMAKLTFAIIRRVLAWHADRDDRFESPLAGMARKKATGAARSRVLSDDELLAVWTATSSTGLVGPFIRFLLLTAARHDEAREMSRAEVSNGVWTIPAARHKTGRSAGDLERPLSQAAIAVLEALPRIHPDKYVFTLNGERPFSVNKEAFDKACGVTGWTIHDLRRTARTLMARAGVSFELGERCVGHARGKIEDTYNRHRYIDEMRDAFEKLAALIDRIANPSDNVIALRK
jgi:integrase